MAKKTSGLEQIPPFITRPIWKDRFVWIGIFTAIGWVVFFWWLFF
jgi:hypothetical protein